MNPTLKEKLKLLPSAPGVYLMKDAQGRVVYVGKAIDLKKRVQTYLNEKDDRYQVRFLMARVADIEFVVTDSEKAAFLLENTLIKKHKPRYNIQLKDDKSYVSIKLSLKDKFPRVYVTRTIKKDGSLYANQRTDDEAPEEFRSRLREHIAENPDRYYVRGEVPRLEDDERDAAFDLWQTARAIADAQRLGRFPRNDQACMRWGRMCSYFALCAREADMNDSTLFRCVESRHEELSSAGTA